MSDEQNTYDGLELINCVASGTHSQIWECVEPGGSQPLVAKLLLPDAIKEKGCLATLKHEAKVQKDLVHPNFLSLHRIVTNKEHAYILMDYFRAPNVKTQLMSDIMALQIRAQKLIEGLCISLAHMHDKGWIHRDIKPENILFNKSGELKLIDFSLTVRRSSGLGKMFAGGTKSVQGTRTYIAPETILKKAPTVQTDMYSLGITLFEILAGQRPFTAPTPDLLLIKHLKEPAPALSEFNKNITPETDEFVRRMLFKKPDKRHANMNELLAELRSLKLFKEDVAQLKAAADQKKKETADAGGDLSKAWSLDSRRDALLTEKGIAPPVKPKKKKSKLAASTPPAAPATPQQPTAPQQPPPAAAFPGQPQPGQFPQFAPPGYFPPGMAPPMPGQPGVPMPQMPQQPFPQQQYPLQGYPPGYPQYPPGVAPPAQPPMQTPAQQPAGTQPVPSAQNQPPQQQIAAPIQQPQPPAAPPDPSVDVISREEAELQPQAPVSNERHASQSDSDSDLPLMDELPDVL